MTFAHLIEELNANLNTLTNTQTTHDETKLLISSMHGLINLFERKLGMIDPRTLEEEDELSNGDIFAQTLNHTCLSDTRYLYTYAEMPNNKKKWFRRNAEGSWEMIKHNPPTSVLFDSDK
jgi:hypothetical protein